MAYAKVELCFDVPRGESIFLTLDEEQGEQVRKWMAEGKECQVFWELEI